MASRPVTRSPAPRRALAALAALAAVALTATGCVSMPNNGPVQSAPVTQGPDAQTQPYVQVVPQPPGGNWSPEEIVQGFLTASASFGSHGEVAREYLTPQYRNSWNPLWSAIVYQAGPNIESSTVTAPAAKNAATVQVNGKEQAYLQGYGSYSVPSASSPGSSSPSAQQRFDLVKTAGGQWRISAAPQELLLTSDAFDHDYQLRNLYFFDPTGRYLVPDPVYVPLQAKSEDLMNGLVDDLITPTGDWLTTSAKPGGATRTALPPDTKISGVTIEGAIAVVNLAGATITRASVSTKDPEVMEQVSAQLLQTLAGATQSGQNVQSVLVEVNGRPWAPPGSQNNPVQRSSKAGAPTGASGSYYYVDTEGYLTSRAGTTGPPVRVARIGTGYSQVAVSPDSRYVAALRGTVLYTGLAGGALARRGAGYVSLSWDVSDDLWASEGARIVMFRGAASSRQPLGQRVPVSVTGANVTVPFTALRVAPDGVRVAIIMDGDSLTFGAISGQPGPNPQITLSQVLQSPLNASTFTGLTWYGPDDVLTLATPGPAVTEYPVSGDTPVPVAAEPGMRSISASYGQVLVAGLSGNQMASDAGLIGAWVPLTVGGSNPAYPG
ncbi:MAG TPA: LpqB family beta-propeller domain-containing protein [Trebonia sp.]